MKTMDSINHRSEQENRDYASWLNGLKHRVRTEQIGQQSVNQLPSC